MNILEMLPFLKAGKIIRMADECNNYVKFLVRGDGPPIGKKIGDTQFYSAKLFQFDYQIDAPELDDIRFETVYEIDFDEVEYNFSIVSTKELVDEFTARWMEKWQCRNERNAH